MGEPGVKLPLPAIHRHPAVKWIMMVAILAVAGLSLPRAASAAEPSVSSPAGPMSGGSFTGTFTFTTYINCSNGVSFNSSYSPSMDGTNNFTFYGAPDGSLLVSVNSGGDQLLSSCGDPLAMPQTNVASYTVTKGAPAPTPTPTPVPTPAPTQTPSGGSSGSTGSSSGSASSSGGSSGSAGSTGTRASGTPAKSNDSSANQASTASAAAIASVTSSATGATAIAKPSPGPTIPIKVPSQVNVAASRTGWHLNGAWVVWLVLAIGTAAIATWLWLNPYRRHRLGLAWSARWLRLEPYIFRLKLALRRRGATDPRRRGLSHHQYSGRLMAHHHTSYPTLAFLLLTTTFVVGGFSLTTQAASSTLSLDVSGAPPAVGATILSPTDGDSFSHNIITASGTCPPGLLVEITRNTDFAGSTLCDTSGEYSLAISLIDGANVLRAFDYDGANQPGPTTALVTVTYTAPLTPTPTTTPSPTPAPTLAPNAKLTPKPGAVSTPLPTKPASTPVSPLVINADHHYYSGLNAGAVLTWPLQLSGGNTPYTLTTDWGDGTTTTTSAMAGTIAPSHTYASAGTFHVVFRVTDNQKRQAILSVVVIVNGSAPVVVGTSSPTPLEGSLVYVWPLLIGTMLVVGSFWLGERDHLTRMRRAVAAVV